jgi:hypothetical protein
VRLVLVQVLDGLYQARAIYSYYSLSIISAEGCTQQGREQHRVPSLLGLRQRSECMTQHDSKIKAKKPAKKLWQNQFPEVCPPA